MKITDKHGDALFLKNTSEPNLLAAELKRLESRREGAFIFYGGFGLLLFVYLYIDVFNKTEDYGTPLLGIMMFIFYAVSHHNLDTKIKLLKLIQAQQIQQTDDVSSS